MRPPGEIISKHGIESHQYAEVQAKREGDRDQRMNVPIWKGLGFITLKMPFVMRAVWIKWPPCKQKNYQPSNCKTGKGFLHRFQTIRRGIGDFFV